MLAARADGAADSNEQRAVDAVVVRIGSPDVTKLAEQVAKGQAWNRPRLLSTGKQRTQPLPRPWKSASRSRSQRAEAPPPAWKRTL